ncbi:hypothetical protein NRP93_000095 [Clostridium botulinum]|nr:hypothetical protein [Clostridium botulinum]
MKKLSIKQKIFLIITIIFFFTTLGFNIKKFKKDIKYISSTAINNKYNNKPNNSKEDNNSIKDHISRLWDTLGESIHYMKININNKEKRKEIETLIDDSVIALNSIHNALNKNYKYSQNSLILCIRDMRNNFITLKEVLEKNNYEKEKILNSIEENYKKCKEENDF